MTVMAQLVDTLNQLLERGGVVMIPLLALSVISLALILERAWFWIGQHRRASLRRLTRTTDALRQGEPERARRQVEGHRGIYDQVTRHLLAHRGSEASAVEIVETLRPRFERFMVSLSTIISAAPVLGILGTVIGIIRSFELLGDERTLTDPSLVSAGIAEALLTTAIGLVILLMTLFPYMIFRGQVDRMLGRLETLAAAARTLDRGSGGSSTSVATAAAGRHGPGEVAASKTEAAAGSPR